MAGDNQAGLLISIVNLSSFPWTRNLWDVGAGSVPGVNWTDQVTSTPAMALEAGDGTATASAEQTHLAWLARDALYIGVGYTCPGQGDFGVYLHQEFEFASTFGWQSEWRYLSNGAFTNPTTDSSPYTWVFPQVSIVAQPTLGDGVGTVKIQIHNHR